MISEVDRRIDDVIYRGEVARRAMDALTPVLEQEGVSKEEKQRIQHILMGKEGEAQLSARAAEALHRDGLLRGFISTSAQTNDEGFRLLKEDTSQRIRCASRYSSFHVTLVDKMPQAGSIAGVCPRLDAVSQRNSLGENLGRFDFTRWILKQEYFGPSPASS